MFHAISCAPPLIKHQSKELTRRSANFYPSAWGDVFLKYTRHDKISYASTTKKIEELKKEVKKMLVNVKDSRELMTLIDVIQRTGVAYHFETYIQEVMKQTHMSNTSGASEDDDDDLYSVAIRFRLLRQHGYKAASDVFKRFKDADGELKGILRSDVRGLLSLYEATHLGVQGEDILDEALVFSNIQLNSLLPQLEPLLAKQITSITRAYFVEAQWFNSGHVPTLDEYMSVASVTSAAPLSTVVSFVGMNEVVREEDFEWVLSKPKLLNAASIICRLKNDIVGHKAEQDRGNVASSVECYMKDNGCSEEKACEKLHEMVAIAWKDLNHGSFLPTPIPTYLTTRVLNLVRAIEVVYQYGDGYTISIHESKTRMASILIDPFPL